MRILIAILVLSSLACSSTKKVKVNDELVGCWLHDRESEQEGSDFKLFAPCTSKTFPASRFRNMYQFKEDGTCNWLVLSPNDAHYLQDGTYSIEDGILEIYNLKKDLILKNTYKLEEGNLKLSSFK